MRTVLSNSSDPTDLTTNCHRILLQSGADINKRDKNSLQSAPHFACDYCHLELVGLLLEAGADKEQITS